MPNKLIIRLPVDFKGDSIIGSACNLFKGINFHSCIISYTQHFYNSKYCNSIEHHINYYVFFVTLNHWHRFIL